VLRVVRTSIAELDRQHKQDVAAGAKAA
jgi:hypothetical protein